MPRANGHTESSESFAGVPRAKADHAPRWRLDQCVTRFAAANTRLAKIYAAIDEASEARFRASQTRDLAETELHAAREQEKTQLAAVALGEVEVTNLDKAEATYSKAVKAHEQARRVVTALETERGAAERELNAARLDRDAALSNVLQHSDAVATLLSEYDQHRAKVASLRQALLLLQSKHGIPQQHRFWDSLFDGPVDPEVSSKWEAAIALLSEDADSPLPGI
jgi:hypothetical protein